MAEKFPTKIYAANVKELEDENLYRLAYARATPARQSKLQALRFSGGRGLSLGVETLLLHGLGELGIDTGKLSYGYGDGGKPYLKGEQGVYFNLSHSGEFALCAISPMEVGCDIEKIKKRSLAVAERFFCREEYEILEAQETPERKRELFFRMWTAKESFMKATGCGMQMGMDSFSLLDAGTTGSLLWEQNRKRYYFRELEIDPGYKCTVCGLDRRIAAEPDMTLELLKFSELFDTEDSLHTEEG